MIDKTRGSRVGKPRGRGAHRGASAPKPAVESNPIVKGPANWGRNQRGKQGGGKTPRQNAQPRARNVTKKTAPTPQPEPKVNRIGNNIFMSSVDTHLAFVADGSLATNQNTGTIALNVMDHIIQPENWDAGLTRNVLCAACFYFASMVTGKQNTASRVAASISWYWEKLIMADPEYPLYVKQQAVLATSVTIDQLEQGYALLWDQRDRLEDLVGDYKQKLAELPTPDVERQSATDKCEHLASSEEQLRNAGEEEWEEGGETEHAPEYLVAAPTWANAAQNVADDETYTEHQHDVYEDWRAAVNEVDQSELDDFDLYVEENE